MDNTALAGGRFFTAFRMTTPPSCFARHLTLHKGGLVGENTAFVFMRFFGTLCLRMTNALLLISLCHTERTK